MSEEKCSASASSAWLDVAAATRDSTRARKKSIAIETTMIAKAAAVASTAWPWPPNRRWLASHATTPDSTNSSAVSASADTLSILPWP